MNMQNVYRIQMPVYYVCDGTEDGLNQTIIDGQEYFFQLRNSRQGARIRFVNGVFTTDTPSMVVSGVQDTEEEWVVIPTLTEEEVQRYNQMFT